MALIEDPAAAERFAKVILDDITLEHDARIRAERDLIEALAPELEEGRKLFRARVAADLHSVYEGELLPWTNRAKTRAATLAPAKMDGTRLLFLVGGVVALIVVVVWLIVR